MHLTIPGQLPARPARWPNDHTAVWTGSEMIVWGGLALAPLFEHWREIQSRAPTVGQPPAPSMRPTARDYHTAVWTGSEMIVWGGYDDSVPFEHRREI